MLLLYHTSRSTDGAEVPLVKSLERGARNQGKGGKGGQLPGHHESSEIRDVELPFNVDTYIDDHAQKRKQEPERLVAPADISALHPTENRELYTWGYFSKNSPQTETSTS